MPSRIWSRWARSRCRVASSAFRSTSTAWSSASMGKRSTAITSPVSIPSSMKNIVTPDSSSPSIIAQITGDEPRRPGSTAVWNPMTPNGGTPRIEGGMICEKPTTTTRSGRSAAISSAWSRTLAILRSTGGATRSSNVRNPATPPAASSSSTKTPTRSTRGCSDSSCTARRPSSRPPMNTTLRGADPSIRPPSSPRRAGRAAAAAPPSAHPTAARTGRARRGSPRRSRGASRRTRRAATEGGASPTGGRP